MVMLSTAFLLVLFAVTAVAVMTRLLGVSEGWWAMIAAGVAILTGLVGLGAAWSSLGQTVDVLSFFGGLVVLTAVLSRAGAIDVVLDRMEGWSGASARRLLLATVVVTALITAVFSNDAAALLITPALIGRLKNRGLPVAPFLLAVAIVANSASLLLPVSNPVNLLILDRNHLPLAGYILQVTPFALVGLVVASAVVVALSWNSLSVGSLAPKSKTALQWGTLRPLFGILLALAVADSVAVAVGFPLGPPTVMAALAALLTFSWRERRSPLVTLAKVRWSLLPLVMGFAILAAGLERSHLLGSLFAAAAGPSGGLTADLRVGVLTSLLAAAVNNLPAAFLVSSGLTAAHHLAALTIPVIAGADLGPNLAPAGSLSTILIFSAARRQGELAPWRGFWRAGGAAGAAGLLSTLGLAALVR
ncbi:MAG: SLC13 family permease [Candidatus Dormibacteria bacterium]